MKLLDTLNSQEKNLFERKTFAKEDHLFLEGQICPGVFYLESGEIEIASYSSSGKKIVYNQIRAGELFGFNLVFSSDPHFRGNVIASVDGSLLSLSKDRLVGLLQSNSAFLEEYLKAQSDFGKSLNEKIKLLGFDSAQERLLFFLQTHQGKATFASISDLAKRLFLERETLSRLVHRLEKEGKVILKKGTIELA